MKKILFGLMAVLLAGVGFGGVSKADLTNVDGWTTDREEPASFSIDNGVISLTVKGQPAADSFYAWQGKKADTNVDFDSTWTVEEVLDVTDEMLGTNNVNVSMWIKVDEETSDGSIPADANVDWSIVGFINDNGAPKFQVWADAEGWKDVTTITPEEGSYIIRTIFNNGVITQYINGRQVNTYTVSATETRPTTIIANARSYGNEFSVKIGVPTVICPNPDVITEDFGAWGEGYPSWYNLGWRYNETFPIDNISSIDVKLLNADNKVIIEYTAEGDQLTYQKDNGYITESRQSSAPFYQEYNGSIIPEGADYDWTVVYGDVNAFVEWAPAKAELTVVAGSDTYTAEATFTQEAQPSLITVVNFDSNGGSAVDSIFVIKNGTITEPAAPTQAGYIFNGWYNGDTKFDFTTAITDVTNLKAQWTKKSSGGGGSSSNKTPTTTGTVETGTVDTGADINTTGENTRYEEGNQQEVLKNGFTREFNNAYNFAYLNGITTMKSISKADMNGNLSRIAMAKMLSQYAINILGKTPDTAKKCEFKDVTSKMDKDYNDGVTLACQLGIMGMNMGDNFRPNDTVVRSEFGTALSRMLFQTSDGTNKYYTTHLSKLKSEKIITNDDPDLQELRGYVMLMLMRSAK